MTYWNYTSHFGPAEQSEQERVDEWVMLHFHMFPNHIYCMECQEFWGAYQDHDHLHGEPHMMALSYSEYLFKMPELIMKRLKGD